jgi:gluconolactonase
MATGDATLNALVSNAENSTFISYDPEFTALLGPSPRAKLIVQGSNPIFFEGSAWAPERNEVWISSDAGLLNLTTINVLDLTTSTVYAPNLTAAPVVNPNGGIYFEGLTYWATFGNESIPSSTISMDPATGVVTTIVNSYFGLLLDTPDNVAWVVRGGSKYMFFTDPSFAAYTEVPAAIPNAVWRFDPAAQALRPVIDPTDIDLPNGVRTNKEGTKLYITVGGGENGSYTSSPAIYEYDLDLNEDVLPVNKRLFGIARRGFPDGLHVDDAGPVWAGEAEGWRFRMGPGR